MKGHVQPGAGAIGPPLTLIDARVLGWIGRLYGLATLAGLGVFAVYIALRAGGAPIKNIAPWQNLVAGLPMPTASDWIAKLGIGLHFVMGTVLAWPILLSARVHNRHRKVHRSTGRIYVAAGFLAGAGGMSFIVTHGTFSRAAAIAFSLWGAVMMLSSVMAYIHARARRFDRHRAQAIRLFTMVLGSWLFDIEIQAWTDWAGGIGMNADGASGPFDLALLVLFFVPNLLVVEVFIRNVHRRLVLPGRLKWPAVFALGAVGLVFAHAIVMASATHAEKLGKHPFDAALDLLLEEGDGLTQLMWTSRSFMDADVCMCLRDARCMVISDTLALTERGPLKGTIGSLSGYGWTARLLGHYVRERGVLSLAEAVSCITGKPAERLGLTDRGRLRAGAWADIVVFDAGAVQDRSSFLMPRQHPAGIEQVLVNGVSVVCDGQRNDAQPGRVLRG